MCEIIGSDGLYRVCLLRVVQEASENSYYGVGTPPERMGLCQNRYGRTFSRAQNPVNMLF